MTPVFSHAVHNLIEHTTSTMLLKVFTGTATFHGAAGKAQRGVSAAGQRSHSGGCVNGQVGKTGNVLATKLNVF